MSFTAPSEPPPLYDRRDLPAGWVKEHDSKSDRDYYVDTLATPPRSIWVHPLDDPEFTRLHRGDDDSSAYDSDDDHHSRHSAGPSSGRASTTAPSPGDGKKRFADEKANKIKKQRDNQDRDHLTVPGASSSSSRPSGHQRTPSASSTSSKRSFFGKLKDKAIGTKEEREAARVLREKRRQEEERLYYQRREAMMKRQQEMMAERRAQYEAYEQQRQAMYAQQGGLGGRGNYYRAPPMNAYGGPVYQDPYAYGNSPYGYGQQQRRGGGGGIGPGGAILGGLVGGLLLGDLLF